VRTQNRKERAQRQRVAQGSAMRPSGRGRTLRPSDGAIWETLQSAESTRRT
jgi:hypothetical protein